MKKIYFLVASTLSLICSAQTILNQSETTTRTVQDPQTVIVTTGFRAVSTTSNPFIAKIGASTDTGGSPVDSGAGSGNPSGTTDTPTNKFHDTQGNIEVTGGGQLQYTLPIALPPGIKSVAPQVNLVYTSGSGNGIAGYGWSISGLSSISRMGKTIEKDGAVGGINLDYSDYYSFNGQRLILKNDSPATYGKNGATYTTEKYSNVLIKSLGSITGQPWTGPEYWEVTFEDGSQAWYGATTTAANTARTPLEYNIVKWKDAQGNYISYNYIQDINTNVAVIGSIEWGGNETLSKPHFNKIDFNYKIRSLFENSYVAGQRFSQGKLLDNIAVFANNKIFKQYNVKYGQDLNISKYEFVENVKELNSDGEEANPVEFFKPTVPYIAKRQDLNANLISENQKFGDFDGDGRIDVLYYTQSTPADTRCLREDINGYCDQYEDIPAVVGGTYIIFNKLDGINNGIKVSDEDLSDGIVVSGILDNNKLYTNQGIITHKENSDPLATRKLVLKTYVLQDNALVLIKQKEIPISAYDLTGKTPENAGPFEPHTQTTTTLGSFKTADINADGKSELIFTAKDYICVSDVFTDPNNGSITARPPVGFETRCHDNYRNFIIDLNGSTTQTSIAHIGISGDINDIDLIDFDGDGRTDAVSKNAGAISWQSDFKLQTNNNYIANKYNYVAFNGELAGLQYGDFNGDGKLDFAVPEKGVEETSNWRLYINSGNNNFKEQYLSNFLIYRKNPYVDTGGRKREVIYTTFAKDLNNDGKDDFVNVQSETFRKHDLGANRDSDFDMRVKINEGSDSAGNIVFRDSYTDHIDSTDPDHFRPINITARIFGVDRFIMIQHENNVLFTYDYFNLPVNYTINKINQGGISTSITYNELDAGNSNTSNFYQSNSDGIYPYAYLKNLISKAVVTQLSQENRIQDFRYRDLVSHFQGRGIIGFRQTARSSWYAAGFENTKIWSGAEIDPLNEGVPVKEWSIHTNIESQIFPTDLSINNTQLTSFKSTTYKTDKLLNNVVQTGTIADADKPKIVTAIVPTSTTSKNFITNDTTTDTVEYGSYYLPNKTISNINSGYGIKTTTLEYLHNLTGVGKDYFVGRPQSKTETMLAYGDTKSAKVDYTYANNLLDTQKTWNRDNSGWLQEKYTYDGFGNITQKVSSNSIDANKQTIKSTYEPQGRFVTKTTDNLGLETNITYNDWGQVLTQIDPLLNKLTNTYDAWGKLLTTKSNLSGTTSYTYEKLGNGDTKVTEYSPDNDQKITFTNNLGQNYKSTTKGFAQGVYTSKSVEFDVLGRKTKDSEPYFEGSETPRWNVIVYDDSVYPGKATATAFNGKQMETSVSGKTTSVKELNGYNRTNTKTTDALGNVVSTTDKGGTITFAYNAAGEQTEAKYDTNSVKTTYDAWGNKIKLDDPSNGVYEYTYQSYFGTISKIKSPKGTKEYTYNSLGQLITQKEASTDGTSTNKVISFNYDDKGRVIGKSGTSKGEAFSSYINFDSQGKSISSGESSNGKYFMQKGITYDDKARVTSYEKSLYSSGTLTKVTIENVYSSWGGDLYQVKDKTSGKILWQLDETNAKGLVKSAKLGGTTINNLYDANYFLINTSHTKTAGGNTVLQMGYTFNAIKNELTHRTRGGDFNLSESFTYDDNNRLLNWTNPKTGVLSNNVYDVKGRITSNDQVGTIKFENTTSLYRPSSVVLNAAGTANYNNDLIQTISYNENNDPIFIDGIKGDVAFQYGLTAMRQRVTYGGNFAADQEGKFTKFYSEDGSYEILKDNVTGQEKHLLYIGGTPYESNIVFIKNYTETTGSYKFLHKDYLGSILAVSDENGDALEQRHYDAWGNFTHLKIGAGAMITDKNIIDNTALLIDRGYTSHEHFAEVGIIHMNGRLYDPLLRRFLNADENIQDPTNTQNYNKYGYVLNNPLLYSDPSGELFGLDDFVAAIIIGAVVGALTYSAGVLISGDYWNFGNFLKSSVFGAVTGAVSFGLGQVFSATTFWASVGNGALAGAGTGGINSLLNGGNFLEGLVKGAVTGGVIGGISYGLGKLFSKPNSSQTVSEIKRNDLVNSSGSEGDPQKYSYGSVKEFEKGYGGLGNSGVENYYLQPPAGYGVAQDGSFYKMTWLQKNFGYGGIPKSSDILGVTVGKNIYLPKAAFATKSLLAESITHEVGHVILNNSTEFILANTATRITGDFAKALDTWGHVAIRKMTSALSNINPWFNRMNIPTYYFLNSKPQLDKLLLPLIKSFNY